MHPWARRNIPQLAGRLALVTGANSGLGWQAARTLAGKGATVVMACRNREQAERARRAILDEYPQARLELADLDLADLASIRACAAGFRQRHARLDLLFNNAGVMFLPLRRTHDGFEMQMGTNHLGHFALTGLLLESLLAAPRPRVVGVTSGFNQFGRLPLDDLNAERGYNRYLAYCHSKQANLLFSLELQRRAGQRGVLLQSLAAHPGYAATNLQYAAPAMSGSRLGRWAMKVANGAFAQSAEMGALPALSALTEQRWYGGAYVGPDRWLETRGYPAAARIPRNARDLGLAARLWVLSEELTGVRFWSE